MKTDEKEAFKEYLLIRGYSPSTRDTICRAVIYFNEWLQAENNMLEQVTYSDVTAYVSYLKTQGNKNRSIQSRITNIRHYYEYLQELKIVQDNPCMQIIMKGIKRRTLHETFTSEELNDIYQTFAAWQPKGKVTGSNLVHKRDKIILGLVIFQGLRSPELARLTTSDIKLQEGKVFIAGSLRSDERTLKLEAHQLFDLMNYINETRKFLLLLTEIESDQLFLSLGAGVSFGNIMSKLLGKLRGQNPKVKTIEQLHSSVISNWLKVHNMRKVQKMAGHRYVSSTEAYKVNNIDDLKEDVSRYHPNL